MVHPAYIHSNNSVVPTDKLLAPHIRHTFLIRSPVKAVPSYYRLCIPPAAQKTGFAYFDPEEVGLKELRKLYEFLSTKLPEPPLLIDSDDLIRAPEAHIRRYCNEVGVDFTDDIMQWNAGRQEHVSVSCIQNTAKIDRPFSSSSHEQFDKWKGFHDDAQNSTGIGAHRKTTSELQSNWPSEVQQAIKDNMCAISF